MSNGSEACCALGICCPAEQRRPAFVKILSDEGVDADIAGQVFDILDPKVAFAPKSVELFVAEIVAMVKAHG